MIMQPTCAVTDCPVCGRPLEIESRYIGQEIACSHCRGHFLVHETSDQELTAVKLRCKDALDRADQLLRRLAKCGDSTRLEEFRLPQTIASNDGYTHTRRTDASLDVERPEKAPQGTALLVEHRDEVFARIATDMAESRMRVVRAKSVAEALELCHQYEPTLVVANINMPDTSGWLLARRLGLCDRRIHVWLYQGRSTDRDIVMAKYVHVEERLVYNGDLLGLSRSIVRLMANLLKPQATASHQTTKSERAAA